MTTLLEDIGAYLQGLGRGTLGTDLFLNMEVQDPDSIIVVSEYLSDKPTIVMGVAIPAIENPRVQVMVRGLDDDYVVTRTKINQLYGDICAVTDGIIGGGTLRHTFVPLDSPVFIGRDNNRRIKLVFNFSVSRYN